MKIPSVTVILCSLFFCYIAHSIYTLVKLFSTPICSKQPCFQSYFATNPKLQLVLFTSHTSNPISSEVTKITSIRRFDYYNEYKRWILCINCALNANQNYWNMPRHNLCFDFRSFDISIPPKTRRNGTLFLHVVLGADSETIEWKSLKTDGPTVLQKIQLTEYAIPRAAAFNLLGEPVS